MRVIQINGPFSSINSKQSGYTCIKEFQIENLIDADLILYQPLKYNINIDEPIDASEGFKVSKNTNKAKAIVEYLESGKSMVIFLDSKMEVIYHDIMNSFEKEDEGTARRKIIPGFNDAVGKQSPGINISSSHKEFNDLSRLLFDNNIVLEYKYLLNSNELDETLAVVKSTNKVIAGVKYYGKGNIIFLPTIANTSQANSVITVSLFASIINLLNKLVLSIDREKMSKSNFVAPEWLKGHKLEGQELLESQINELRDQKDKIETRIEILNDELERLKNIRNGISATGKYLEDIVAQILGEFGFTVSQPSGNRVDIIVEHNNHIVVCEVKGVSKSASERNVAQLTKWHSIYVENTGNIPKGLLVVNTWRDKMIKERNESFPNQMLKYLENCSHACIDIINLIELHQKYVRKEIEKEEIWDKIYNTIGVINIQ